MTMKKRVNNKALLAQKKTTCPATVIAVTWSNSRQTVKWVSGTSKGGKLS